MVANAHSHVKQFADAPIYVPGSPFWNVFRRFGRDEAIAIVINVVGTAIAGFLTANPLLLSLTGPVVEKLGFFPGHFYDALGVFRTTPIRQRKHLWWYVRGAFHGGLTSFVEDILVHDPVYVFLMFFGLTLYTGTPAWLLSGVSFVVAVFVVAGLEVGFTEARYIFFKQRLRQYGFSNETYYESRFFLPKTWNALSVLRTISSAFGLRRIGMATYHDQYFPCNLPSYSGREPRLRLRRRVHPKEHREVKTVQIVYTRAYELSHRAAEQHRYFPIKKEKLYAFLPRPMPKTLEGIREPSMRSFLMRCKGAGSVREVRFLRRFAHHEELLVTLDTLGGRFPYFVLELKVYSDVALLKKAMRYVMVQFPGLQTTQSKADFSLSS